MPTIPPDVTWLKPLYSKAVRQVWAEMQELDIPLNAHGGTGSPELRQGSCCRPAVRRRGQLSTGKRPFVHLLLSGVFERFPPTQVRDDRNGLRRGCPGLIRNMDNLFARARAGARASCASAMSTCCRSRRRNTSNRTVGSV
jgi:hypothetical protein